MLIQIQKILNSAECPSCNKNQSLQVAYSCSRDNETCQPVCRCSNCGLTLFVETPEHINSQNIKYHEFDILCDINANTCKLIDKTNELFLNCSELDLQKAG